MKTKIKLLLFFSLVLIVFSCKKSEKEPSANNNSSLVKSDSTNYYSEARGNKLFELDSINKNSREPIHYSIGNVFINKGKNGVLKNLINQSTQKKYYNEIYNLPISVLKSVIDKHNNINGILFTLVELDRKYYKEYINIDNDVDDKFLYFIATPIDVNNNPIKDKNYLIFNVKKFDINSSLIDDKIFGELKTKFSYDKSDIFKKLKDYHAQNGISNTVTIYYSKNDLETNVLGYDASVTDLKFRIAEIADINTMISKVSSEQQEKYKKAYDKRAQQLIIIGQYYPSVLKPDSYFDMGTLYP